MYRINNYNSMGGKNVNKWRIEMFHDLEDLLTDMYNFIDLQDKHGIDVDFMYLNDCEFKLLEYCCKLHADHKNSEVIIIDEDTININVEDTGDLVIRRLDNV